MRLYYDSEFTGLHQSATLISLALVDEVGRGFYAEFSDYASDQCDEWLEENVLAHCRWLGDSSATEGLWREDELTLCHGDSSAVRETLTEWIAPYDTIEIWADCPAWDWVLFCQLFGGALSIPSTIFYIPFDLATLFKVHGIDPDIGRATFAGEAVEGKQHNALFDARVLRACYRKLMQ